MELKIRECQIIEIPTKTHTIVLASKKDIPDAEKRLKEILDDFEIIRVYPNVKSGELIASKPAEAKRTVSGKSSVVADYLKIKDLLPDRFTAHEYHEQIISVKKVLLPSVYADFKMLIRAGKIVEVPLVKPRTFQKIHPEDIDISNKLREDRVNIIQSAK